MTFEEYEKVTETTETDAEQASFFNANKSRFTRDRAARRKATAHKAESRKAIAKSIGYDWLTDREIGKMKNHSAVSHYVGKEPHNRHKVERFADGNEPFNPYDGDNGFRCGKYEDTFRINGTIFSKAGDFFIKSAGSKTCFVSISKEEYEEAKCLSEARIIEPGNVISIYDFPYPIYDGYEIIGESDLYVVYKVDGDMVYARAINGRAIKFNKNGQYSYTIVH